MHDWDEICESYGPLVWSTVYRVLNHHAESLECYQDVFLEAFTKTRERPVDDWPSLLKWLSVRRAIDRLRQRTRLAKRVVYSPDAGDRGSTDSEPTETAQFNELLDRVSNELAQLPEHQSEAFWLGCVEQMSYAAVAEHLGIKKNAVGVLIHRARFRLKQVLGDSDQRRDEGVSTHVSREW